MSKYEAHLVMRGKDAAAVKQLSDRLNWPFYQIGPTAGSTVDKSYCCLTQYSSDARALLKDMDVIEGRLKTEYSVGVLKHMLLEVVYDDQEEIDVIDLSVYDRSLALNRSEEIRHLRRIVGGLIQQLGLLGHVANVDDKVMNDNPLPYRTEVDHRTNSIHLYLSIGEGVVRE